MNNQIHDQPTWVHYQLAEATPIEEIARLVESEILKAGFTFVGQPGSKVGASSSLANGDRGLSGESILDVIPSDGTPLSAATVRLQIRDRDLQVTFRIGEADTPSFDSTTRWDSFTIRLNCRMDSNRLRQIAEESPDPEHFNAALENPRIAYRLVKRLFDATNSKKCIGIDDKYLTGKYFTDPPAFYFSRNELTIPSELLEYDYGF
jgi:hypothetical protein